MAAACLAAALAASACVSPQREESVVGDYLSGRFAARVNDIDGAAEAFASAHREAPVSEELLRDAFFFQLAAGRVEAAVSLARELIAEPDLDDGLARTVLAADAVKRGAYAEARTLLEEDIDVSYLSAAVAIVDAWALAGLEGPNAARALLSKPAAELSRGFNPLHEALLAEKAGEEAAARAAFQVSVLALGGPVARTAYGAFLERSGDEIAAREFYDLLARDPGPDRIRAQQGVARLDAGRASQAFAGVAPSEGAAIALYSMGAAVHDQYVRQREAASRAGFRVGPVNYNLPLALVQLALHLDPELDDALRFTGWILNNYGEHEKALEVLGRLKRSSPYYEQAIIDRASALTALERDEEAIALLSKAMARNPEALEAGAALGNLLATRERHGEAIDALNAVIARLPDEPDEDAWRYYVTRGASYLALDDWPRAEADLKRAVDIAPEEPTALNYLGYSWAERGLYLDEAFALIEKAVSLRPASGAIIDSLGWAHYQLGNYDDAVGHLEHAASLEPADPTITDHLGDVYWRLGRRSEARFQWRRVLELDPDEAMEAAVAEKLKSGLADPAPAAAKTHTE